MRVVPLCAALVLSMLLAGCTTEPTPFSPDVAVAYDPLLPTLFATDGTVAQGTLPLLWQGPLLWDQSNAEHRTTFRLDIPQGTDRTIDRELEVAIQWFHAGRHLDMPGQADLQLTVHAPDGTIHGYQPSAAPMVDDHNPIRSLNPLYGKLVLIPDPAPGDYEVIVEATDGQAQYRGVAQLEQRPAASPARDLLPDLTMLPPTDLVIDHPGYFGVIDPDPAAANRPGCHPEEYAEDLSRTRCLRFSFWLANVGEGPLVVQMKDEDAVAAFAEERPIQQHILQTDGQLRERPAGAGLFHATHAHLHIRDAVDFQIHTFNLETQTMGEAVTSQQKIGWNPGNLGLVALGLPHTAQAGAVCSDPDRDMQTRCMELASSWVDEYAFDLFHQFIDITGVPDGVYQLASVANIGGNVEESDLENNDAATVFRLTGDVVEILGRYGPGGAIGDTMPHPHDGEPVTMPVATSP